MWELYVASFFAGAFAANGVPHFVKGVTGQKHMTPFGRPSSAVVNVAWGWANFVVAAGLLAVVRSHIRLHPLRTMCLVGAGVLIMGLLLAMTWSKHPEYNK
ncbi:MAG TPA: hypothetical protein VGS28_02435 [Candidatus Saccharimonadales bacterium]|nr:hypothetical protein [Candidatus Saccharimonadales bacterium]